MEKIYFLDSYALIEIAKENKNYEKFNQTNNITTLMNLLEVHNRIIKDFSEVIADSVIQKLKRMVIDFDLEDIKLASRTKAKFRSKKLSYIDCLGYAISLRRDLIFVTGDKEFKDMENVEFVK